MIEGGKLPVDELIQQEIDVQLDVLWTGMCKEIYDAAYAIRLLLKYLGGLL